MLEFKSKDERIDACYEESKKCKSSLETPVLGEIKIPLCKICQRSEYHYGTREKPECLAYGGEIPEQYRRCRDYNCPKFLRDTDPKNKNSQFFDESHQPIPWDKLK